MQPQSTSRTPSNDITSPISKMNAQYKASMAVSAICDPDFSILSLRYRRNKDGTIIRYRNFELHSATLHKRLETFGRSLRLAGIREAQHDLITMLEGRVIAKAQDYSLWDKPDSRAGAFIKSRLDLVLHLALDTLYEMDENYSMYLPKYETLFTDKISPYSRIDCPFGDYFTTSESKL
ncbi:hypothetical protein EXIGLDRAFT_746906 [Exidia glandulosa HHB12029]|uniref:Uncharacterized protein n=1 Tax=Exidia glandulosa HHB12029 TaxID=1314781 RepID=A0A165LHK7_EXIGL|nr:hypothetical protein EXIGLDRAFT_746906 [Exidia glandulosa HHB12029]